MQIGSWWNPGRGKARSLINSIAAGGLLGTHPQPHFLSNKVKVGASFSISNFREPWILDKQFRTLGRLWELSVITRHHPEDPGAGAEVLKNFGAWTACTYIRRRRNGDFRNVLKACSLGSCEAIRSTLNESMHPAVSLASAITVSISSEPRPASCGLIRKQLIHTIDNRWRCKSIPVASWA